MAQAVGGGALLEAGAGDGVRAAPSGPATVLVTTLLPASTWAQTDMAPRATEPTTLLILIVGAHGSADPPTPAG